MTNPVQVRRDEFVGRLGTTSLDVNALRADSRMLNVDVGAADLDHDGQISGTREAGALFDQVDRLDRDGDANALTLGLNGRATATAAPIAAIADLANAPSLQLRANEALPGISQGAGRNRTTGILFPPRPPLEVARELQVQTIRNWVGGELSRQSPDYDRVFREMGKLSKDEAAQFVRDLRTQHNSLYQKLGSVARRDEATRATVLSDEPALTRQIIAGQAKHLGRTAIHGMPSETIAELTAVPRDDRAEVVRKIYDEDRSAYRALAQVCRDSQDPVLIDAFRRAGLRP